MKHIRCSHIHSHVLSTLLITLPAILTTTLIASSALAHFPARPTNCDEWRSAVTGKNSAIPFNTDQIVIANRGGKVLYSWADGGYRVETPHQLWSVSKTVTATLAAIAIGEGRLHLSDKLTQYVPASWRTDAAGRADLEKITIEELLSMTSGFSWSEHSTDRPENTSDLPMLYSQGYRDVVRYSLQLDFAATPGTHWNYSTVNGNLLMAALRKIYGASYESMPWTKLFKPLGMSSAHVEKDKAGNFISAAYVYLSAIDMAKLGELYLNDGVTPSGKRLLPVGWVKRAQEIVPQNAAQIHTPADLAADGPYSKGGFWLNRSITGLGRPLEDAPESMYSADGLFGQVIYILPEQNIVVVRTGHEINFGAKANYFISGARACYGK